MDIGVFAENHQDIAGEDLGVQVWIEQHFTFVTFDCYNNKIVFLPNP